MNYLRSEDQSRMLLLLDFEKAFDTLYWEYIFKALSASNFGPSFINWAKIVYKNASSSVTNNGYFAGVFQIQCEDIGSVMGA